MLKEKGGSSPSSHARAMMTLEKQRAALEERESKLVKQKEHLEATLEKESKELQQIQQAHQEVDKALADLESLETEENQE